MDDLTRYVINYYGKLMTKDEASAYTAIMIERKATVSNSPAIKMWFHKRHGAIGAKALALLEEGEEAFFLRLRERVLREHADSVFLNLCPYCQTLARTPRARQCRKCFRSWQEEAG